MPPPEPDVFGSGTDQHLATTLSSNASTHIRNLAAQDVVKANIGLERVDQAQLAGFQQGLDPATVQPTGQQFTPDQFSDYSSKWNTAHDARAFVADHLTPQQFSTMLSGMSPADQVKFGATLSRRNARVLCSAARSSGVLGQKSPGTAIYARSSASKSAHAANSSASGCTTGSATAPSAPASRMRYRSSRPVVVFNLPC